jgi:hypothetical protein
MKQPRHSFPSCAALALMLAGCASSPSLPYDESVTPAVLATLDDAGVRDLRASYRAALCPRLAADRKCDDVLLRLPGEVAAAASPPARIKAAERYRIVIVPGLLADCVAKWVVPFSDAAESLRAEGFEVDLLNVAGRADTEHNAAQLAPQFAALPDDGRRLIVFGYSKGLPDVLELLLRYPAARARVAAVVSYAGAVNGSPLADSYRTLYANTLAGWSMDGCAKGTGADLDALRRSVRLAWWQAHRAELKATGIPFFSLAGAPRPEQVSPVLRLTYNELSRMDPRNDSQLLASDAVVPGGALLGYVNADHWSIAMPLLQQFPSLYGVFTDGVPRPALVAAAVEVVVQALGTAPAATAKP